MAVIMMFTAITMSYSQDNQGMTHPSSHEDTAG
jgi:hypothetical protein